MYARARKQGIAKVQRPPLTPSAKAKMNRTRARTSSSNRAVAQQSAVVAQLYRQVRGNENKFFDPWTADGNKQLDFNAAGTLANSAGGYILTGAAVPSAVVLNQVPQGTTQNSRLGRKAHFTGCHIKGRVQASATGTVNNWAINLVHIIPPNNPSQMVAYNEIWVAQSVNSLRNVDNSDKVKICRQLKGTCTGNATTPATGQEIIFIDEFVDLKKFNVITEWTGADTTGVYGNMEKGGLCLYLQSSTAGQPPQFFGSVRLYFNDY